MKDKVWFVSWSGGKDSCLALYKALKEGKKVNFLLNFAVDGKAHGINREIIKTQADAIGIKLIQKITTWENYEKDFNKEVKKLKKKGAIGIIAGDIDLEEHLKWIKRKSIELGIDYYEPLWKRKREEILNEFVSVGFESIVVYCIEKAKFLIGKFINKFTLEEFIKYTKEKEIDFCGENGEFHTLVIDGPIFNKKIEIIESEKKEINDVKYGRKFILDIKKWKLKRKN